MIASTERGDKDVHGEPVELLVEKEMKPLKFVLNQPGYGYEKIEALKRKSRK